MARLLAHEVPGGGGETWFADMRATYETLPDMRRTTVMAWPPPVVLDPRFRDRFDPAQFEAMMHD